MSTKRKATYNEQIKQRDKHTINGYMRHMEMEIFSSESFYNNIPLIINYLCVKYYHISTDRFNHALHGDNMKVTDNKISFEFNSAYQTTSAFLSNTVHSGCHHWKFRLNCFGNDQPLIYVGVWKSGYDPQIALNLPFCSPQVHGDKALYALNCGFGKLRGCVNIKIIGLKYCNECIDGDIVDMYLDLNNHELKYSVNDKDCGKAFDVEVNQSYTAVVCFGESNINNIVKLVSYETRN
eukprot:316831_1